MLLNPFRSPTEPDECWYNFCHSSTRFFVEETFGRWKNRFRVLLAPTEFKHAKQTRLIYATMVLHNLCTIHQDEVQPFDLAATDMSAYFAKRARLVCPSCARRNVVQCVHTGRNRRNAADARVGSEPARQRAAMKERLWCELERCTEEPCLYGRSLPSTTMYKRRTCVPIPMSSSASTHEDELHATGCGACCRALQLFAESARTGVHRQDDAASIERRQNASRLRGGGGESRTQHAHERRCSP